MGVAEDPDLSAGRVAAGLDEGGFQAFADFFTGFADLLLVRRRGIADEEGEGVHQAFVGRLRREIALGEPRDLEHRREIEHEVPHVLVHHAEADATVGVTEGVGYVLIPAVLIVGLGAEAGVAGVALEREVDRLSRLRVKGDEEGRMLAADKIVLRIDDPRGLSVLEAEDLHGVGVRDGAEDLTVGFRGYRELRFQPDIAVFGAPFRAGGDLRHGGGVRGQAEVVHGLEGEHGTRLADRCQDLLRVEFQRAVEFPVGPVDVDLIVHVTLPLIMDFEPVPV